jgi:D-alanyl-D-alanine dipeptidase
MKKLLLIAATAFFANLIAGEVPIVIATGAGLPLPPIDSLLLNRNGFVDIQQVDSSILVHLVYATSENFLKKKHLWQLYPMLSAKGSSTDAFDGTETSWQATTRLPSPCI